MSHQNSHLSEAKKKYYENSYQLPNHRPSLSFGADKNRILQLSLNTTSVTKHTNGVKKQDSLISITSQVSNCENEDESPQSQKQQIYQIEKQKAENKNKMIEDFKNFIIKQHQQKNSSNNDDIFSNNNKSNVLSYSNSSKVMPSFSKIKSQSSFQMNELEQKHGKAIKFSEDTNPTPNQNTESIPIQKKLQRQNTISLTINKKLKIAHKTRDQLFNEKLQLFKGVSTYIETRQYLQNLNLLNKKNLIENMKKNQQWNEEFKQIKEKQQFNEQSQIEDDSSDEEETLNQSINSEKNQTISKEEQLKQKFNVENPNFDKNINLLLDKAYKHVVDQKKASHTRQNKSLNDIDSEKTLFKYIAEALQVIGPEEFLDNTDENQFYETLKAVLLENKKLAQQKQEEQEEDQIFLEQQKKKYEYELLNKLYQNPQLLEKFNSEQIQEFINQEIKLKFDPQAVNKDNKSIIEKLIGSLNIDLKHTSLDAKSQYQEYVEKATHIQKTLKRLNENMFKSKWANAQIKRIKEKERMRNQIIKQIQNNEIEFNKMDVLFPSKNKMKNIKSKVNSNLEFSHGGYIVRSNSIDDSPKQTVQELFNENISNQNHQSHRSVIQDNQSTSTFTNKDGRQVGFSTRDIITTNSLRLLDFKEPDNNTKSREQSYYYQAPSGYVRQVTKVDLTEEEKQKKQEIFEKQQLKRQQEQLKKEVLQNITHFNAKKSSAPSLSSIELPKLQSNININLPQSALNSPNTKNLSSYHLLKDSYLSKNQIISSKPSSLMSSPLKKQTQSKFIKIGKDLNNKSQSSQNIYFNKMNSYHSNIFTPQKQKDKQNSDKNTKSIIKYQSSHTLDSQFDVSPQKSQLFNMLNTIQSEKKMQKKEKKELDEQINKIQSNCSLDFTNLNGNQIGSMKDILDIDFLKFSMQKNRHIHDSNIKNFLKMNN